MENEKFSLCWNNFHNNLRTGFHSLLKDEDLVDVTLAAGGKYIKAHKTVLSICSPYFKELFRVNPCKHPIVILQDVNHSALSSLLQFMYQGEVSVSQTEIPAFMKVAETLKVKGLTENSSDSNGSSDNFNMRSLTPQSSEDSNQLSRRQKLTKKVPKPTNPWKPILPKTEEPSFPSIMSPPILDFSPQPSPAKRPCLEDSSDIPTNLVTPKFEPIDTPEDLSEVRDEYQVMKDEYHNSLPPDASPLMDDSGGESSKWATDNMPADASRPGTLQCILGKRGVPRLIVDGHSFFKKGTYRGKTFWYCKKNRSTYKCQAVCWTYLGQITRWPDGHCHPIFDDYIKLDEEMEVPIDKIQDII